MKFEVECEYKEPQKSGANAEILATGGVGEKAATEQKSGETVESARTSMPEFLYAKLARPLLEPGFPLSASGMEAAKRVAATNSERALQYLPTVENPLTEYFSELTALNPEKERELFGARLSNVQTTKGCRHQCTFCAGNASQKVETMPFQAVLKIGEHMQKAENIIMADWTKFCNDLGAQLHIDTSFMYDDRFKSDSQSGSEWDARAVMIKALGMWGYNHQKPQKVRAINEMLIRMVPRYQVLVEYFRDAENTPEELLKFTNGESDRRSAGGHQGLVTDYVKGFGFPIVSSQLFCHINNYYDSDPFDYRDRHFSHNDGSPADYGDVVEILASKKRKIHITTAGWPQSDLVAKRAAEKIARKGKEFLDGVRISVSPYEIRARRNVERYMSDMIQVYRMLQPLDPQILLYGDEGFAAFFKKAIKQTCPDTDQWRIERPRISYFSGRAKGMKPDKDVTTDHDVMACAPGYYIMPDGSVSFLRRSETMNKAGAFVVPGDRPVPTGQRLW